ncbi:hypothetical protein GCM10011489_20130 [Gordonia jinhuaensis]|uniref:Uncharacterized protein n=1 Tax=Gordonia jinhuaensis TaxID=1517702 RepID=A0A916T790_9ACTN|nr:hypothetical protein GCM10011489_20130 [Gordonia jinhuaensis]
MSGIDVLRRLPCAVAPAVDAIGICLHTNTSWRGRYPTEKWCGRNVCQVMDTVRAGTRTCNRRRTCNRHRRERDQLMHTIGIEPEVTGEPAPI